MNKTHLALSFLILSSQAISPQNGAWMIFLASSSSQKLVQSWLTAKCASRSAKALRNKGNIQFYPTCQWYNIFWWTGLITRVKDQLLYQNYSPNMKNNSLLKNMIDVNEKKVISYPWFNIFDFNYVQVLRFKKIWNI